jgi:hypothetical protein
MSGEAGHVPGEEYSGTAEVLTPDTDPIAVEVHLRGHVEPVDGRFHWYGRIAADGVLASAHRPGSEVALRTPHGIAAGRIADVDPWGRFRITGLGAPPF